MSLTEGIGTNVLYRVSLRGDTGRCDVITLGTFGIDDSFKGAYDLEDLPQQLQDKLAVLQVLRVNSLPIDGVGARIGESTFWIYK